MSNNTNNTNNNNNEQTQAQAPATLTVDSAKALKRKWAGIGAIVGIAAGVGGTLAVQAYRAGASGGDFAAEV